MGYSPLTPLSQSARYKLQFFGISFLLRTSLMIKKKKVLPQVNKDYLQTPMSKIILNNMKFDVFQLRLKNGKSGQSQNCWK